MIKQDYMSWRMTCFGVSRILTFGPAWQVLQRLREILNGPVPAGVSREESGAGAKSAPIPAGGIGGERV